MQARRVYLVRHGETKWNNIGRYQGHSDIALSDNGQRQAELLRERFRRVHLDAAYASDLKRARETATTIVAPHGLEVNLETGLREVNFGAWEGLSHQEIVAAFPKEWDEWCRDPGNRIIPRGESFYQVKERVVAAFSMIVRKEKGRSILLVAHGGCLRVLICSILGMDSNAVWRFRLDNTGVSIVDCYGENKILALLNDTSHLERLGGPDESGVL